jgi:dolichol-phosphate mannosyltransferase
VLVMDADMSHPVESLPSMIKPIMEHACDATVGSRYIKSGGSEKWPILRRVISRGAGLLAKGVTDLTDPTSGFMAFRKDLIKGVNLDPVGWKIVLEVIVKAKPSVHEIPIVFSDRIKGESKLTWKAEMDYLRHLVRLYNHEYGNLVKFIKFCLVGFSGMIIDTAVLIALVELLTLDPRVAAVFAFLVAVSWNFICNQQWTFSSANYSKNLRLRYLSFFTVSFIGLVIRISCMDIILRSTALNKGRGYIIASVLGILAATVFNFFGSKFIAFKIKFEPDAE